ncbi:Asp23/Gls24 family envelope stress response protein [Rhodococcus globerulus]|uniref:Asp23/Gls24 family envelope stress response protein n=1 Tax=Rhodococcus globerulus TaxID=33008 RepID=A0ABU4C4V5_RHOGO|nr:Asp23/Gls24 family envelope stress response protein [Rhodococcus globerulus]MDV6271535.1 Asp23/Gls24 family envelope stress response protein [Rhodococcus globerulus]
MANPPPADVDPGQRGRLIIRGKVAQRLAVRAALDTPGVQVHAAGLDKITGREYPKVRVFVSANRVRAHLDIAVAWSQSLPEVARNVQRNVADALTTYAGLQVHGVDVVIAHVVAEDAPRSVE